LRATRLGQSAKAKHFGEHAPSGLLNRGTESQDLTSLLKLESSGYTRLPRVALLFTFLIGLVTSLGFPSVAHAQLNSNIANVNLNAVLSTSLTVSAAPGLVNFALLPNGVANGSVPINVTTSWTLSPSVGNVSVWAYFSTAAAALSDGAGDNIPSSSVLGSPDGGAFTAFSGVSPFAAATSLKIVSFKILGNNKSGTRTDTLALQISTVGLALPAGTYTGVLNIQAQAL